MDYRPEIDGLRTLAVVPVVLFHAGFSLFMGGFVGVDIFFVISGYLITTILMDELKRGRFSILRFYERRARRILPALFFVILACLPFAWMWMLPEKMEDFGKSVVSVLLFASNILFWRQTSYFGASAAEKPLLHTWSLAVEEQFYVLFPLFLWLLWHVWRRGAVWGIALVALLSLLIGEWGWRHSPWANFYLAPTRAWELLAGSLCAFRLDGRRPMAPGWARELAALAGLALILGSILAIDETRPWPSVWTLVPVAGTVLVILFAGPQTRAGQVLSLRPMVGLGLISYSAYLWHQPVFAFARIRSLVELTMPDWLGLSVLSFGLGWLSWRFIEQPFRGRGLLSSRGQVFTASGAGLVALLAVGSAIIVSGGAAARFPPELLSAWSETRATLYTPCHFREDRPLPHQPVSDCLWLAPGDARPSVLLVGDSHMDVLSVPLREMLERAGISYYVSSYTGCLTVPGFTRFFAPKSFECDRFVDEIYDYAERIGIRTIVLATRLQIHVEGTEFDNGEGGVESVYRSLFDTRDSGQSELLFDEAARKKRLVPALQDQLTRLAGRFGLVLVYPVPEAGWNVYDMTRKYQIFHGGSRTLDTSLAVYKARVARAEQALDGVRGDRVFRVHPDQLLCDPASGRCANEKDGIPLYFDDDHLSRFGARPVAQRMMSAVLASLDRESGPKAH